MKKITKLLVITLLSLLAFSCSNINNNFSESEAVEYGSATLKMFVPDYYLMAENKTEGRAVSPQTSFVQLSAYNSITGSWNLFEKVDLEAATKTPVDNAPEGFSGSVYTFVFSKVYAKNYPVGTLKVSLYSASGVLLSSGTNATAVNVVKGQNSSTTFYTLPYDSSKKESSLSAGEMKFCSFNFAANAHYTLRMEVTGSVYPDIVIFDEKGTFQDYYVIDDAESCVIDFPANSSASTKYIGVWADDGSYVSKYSINLYTDLTDFTFKDSSIGFWGGESYQINLAPVPSDAYLGKPTYTSSNEKITVSDKGVISGVEEAEGIITVSYGGITHTIAVNVYESATELSGVLSGDKLHWTKENSPYKVVGDCLVEEAKQLVIDPGVKVYFAGNYYVKMNGSIYAVGTKEEPVIITKAASYSGYWTGFNIAGGSLSTTNTYQYSSGNILKYVDFSYADTPVSLGAGTYVDHCKFMSCSNYIYISSNSILINNEFENGVYCYSGTIYLVNNRINNVLRINNGGVKYIYNNTISSASIYLGYSDTVRMNNNIFNGGTWSINGGVYHYYIQNNNFLNYNGAIISVTTSHDSYKKTYFTGNYWGESQTAELIANEATGEKNVSFISDYWDNFNYTEVDYSDWVREPIETAGYRGDAFIAFDYTVNGYNWNNGGYYPESKDTTLTIAVTPQYNVNEITSVRVFQGYENISNATWQPYTGTVSFDADKTNLSDGYAPIYVQLKDNKGNISSAICHKVPFDSPVITCNLDDGSSYTNVLSQQLKMNVTDNGKITEYDIAVDGVSVKHDTTSTTSDYWTYTLGLAYMYSGTHTITMKAWDVAGNLTTKEISILVTNSNSDVSGLAGTSWDSSSGQFLKDSNTVYLWHLDEDGAESAGDESNKLAYYTKSAAVTGLGGCASYVYSSNSISIDVSTGNAYTVEFWKIGGGLDILQGSVFYCDIGSYGIYRWYYKQSSGSVTYNSITSPSFSADEWHYWSLVYNGTYAAIYCDGLLCDYATVSTTLNSNENKLTIDSSSGYAYDEIRISKVARSADEIKAYYDCAKEKIQ